MASKQQYVATVAIDFGTTYSGFAYSFTKGEAGIHMNREWGNEEGRFTMKTPTTILLRPNKAFDSFGYDAEEKYAHFSIGEVKDFYYFKHFKMELHKSKVCFILLLPCFRMLIIFLPNLLSEKNGWKVQAYKRISVLTGGHVVSCCYKVCQVQTTERLYFICTNTSLYSLTYSLARLFFHSISQ